MDRKKVVAVTSMAVAVHSLYRGRRKRKVLMKRWLRDRAMFSDMKLLKELSLYEPSDFKNYLRMDVTTFQHLLQLVTPYLQKEDTNMRASIPPEERLVTTLRFLATGRSYECLKYSSGISAQSIGRIVPETCRVIFNVLKAEYLKFPTTEEEWRKISSGFEYRWNFPNCGGAIDGKHIRIVRPADSGALYYNYKNFYSVVLLAIVNASYEFIYIDVGKNGRNSDGGVFEYSKFWCFLNENKLHLPKRENNVGKLNFVFLADDAFPAHENILKRFTIDDRCTAERKIFNYRHSRGRTVIENGFGIINSRFRVLNTAINVKVEHVNYVVLAICALHNFLCRKSTSYLSNHAVDSEDKKTHIRPTAEWCSDTTGTPLCDLHPTNQRPSLYALENRDRYAEYFSEAGKVPWQNEMVDKGK